MYACTAAISLVPTLCVTTCTFHKKDGDFRVDGDGDDDDDPAYSHHDKIPLWWENVNDDKGGNVSNMNILIIFSLIPTMPGAMYAGATPARLVGREMAR